MKRLVLLALALTLTSQTALAASKPGEKTAHKSVLPFLENDYATALKEARARGVPIFIDAWAPW